MNYRVYLIDASGHIFSAEWLSVPDDATALKAAQALCDACSDMCAGVEVWLGPRRIHQKGVSNTVPEADDRSSMIAFQDTVLDLEERLHRSSERIRTSRRLLAEMDKIRTMRSGGAPMKTV